MSGTKTLKGAAIDANTGNVFPWAGQPDETACNYAFGHLIRNVPPRLTIENKMHAPTMMAAAGAIAGVCAQVSLLANAERVKQARENETLKEMKLKDGRIFLFGDTLNEMLYSISDAKLARSRVWNMMVMAALQKGLDSKDLPNVPAMFRHVNESFGTDKEGLSSVPANAQPVMPVRDMLKLVGPVAFAALAGELKPTTAVGGEVLRANRKSWVAITAQLAGNLLLTSSRVMPPALCLTIAMESAIYASKMRANVVEQEPAADAPQA